MLEVVQEHVQGEGGRIPHDEALAGGTPGDDPVQPRLADEIVRLGQERRPQHHQGRSGSQGTTSAGGGGIR